ncbi:MAG: adenosylcobinamide amidohydrolase [Gammaproteobacteria bacterium]|nr:adenosylcobinamide amidohydrolase [Gammaproteobacteria bacterium]
MLLETTDHYAVTRQGRFLTVAFRRPHRVISTCRVNGGLREDLTHLANHQCCEGVAHAARAHLVFDKGPRGYHDFTCAEAAIPPDTSALMSTAANMQCAVLSEAAYRELNVRVIATAGVLGNATRASDPAGWHEESGGSARVTRTPADTLPAEAGSGTIVALVLINQPCTPACLVKAATLVTEGKSVALLDLRMPSLQSAGLATGTGTDQLAIAAPLPVDGDWSRHWAGSHNTLGELLGRATHEAITRCLLLQNGICAELRRSICGALGRFGCTEERLRTCAEAELAPAEATLFSQNLQAVIFDPQSAAAAYCLAECLELAGNGILHREVAREALLNQAALLAATVAVQPECFAEFRQRLQTRADREPAEIVALAVVWGFARKWN